MDYKLTVDDIRRVVDQHKDYKISIITDGLGTYVARIANAQAIGVAKVLLAEIERLQQERNKLIEGLKFYANGDNWRSGFVLGRAQADGGERAQAILDEIGGTVE